MASSGDFAAAKRQLTRAAKFNRCKLKESDLEKQLTLLETQIKLELKSRRKLGGESRTDSYLTLVTIRTYLKDTLILSYLVSPSYLFYLHLKLDFAYVANLSLEANFISGKVCKWIVCFLGATLL